ncbi:unnamed protein product, partial [Cuscuta epithymum]
MINRDQSTIYTTTCMYTYMYMYVYMHLPIQMAPRLLKLGGRCDGFQWNSEMAFNFGLLPYLNLDPSPKLQPDFQSQLHINFVGPCVLLAVVAPPISGVDRNNLRARKRLDLEGGGVLVALVERRHVLVGGKPLTLVERRGFDRIVVDADPFVRVPDGHVDGEVVAEGVVGEVELGEGGVVDVEFELVRAEDEPEHHRQHAQNDDGGADELADAIVDAAAEAADGVAASAAGAVAVVGVRFLHGSINKVNGVLDEIGAEISLGFMVINCWYYKM